MCCAEPFVAPCAALHPLHELQRSLQEQEDFRAACLSAIAKLHAAIHSHAAASACPLDTLSVDAVGAMSCAELAAHVASLRRQKAKLHEISAKAEACKADSDTRLASNMRSGASRGEASAAVPNSPTHEAVSAYAEEMLAYHTQRLAACQVGALRQQ